MAKAKSIDLNKLDPAARKRVERLIAPKDKRLALLFVGDDVERWERAATKEGFDSLSGWMEINLDAAVGRAMPQAIRGAVEQAAIARDSPLNRRFNSDKLKSWKKAANLCEVSLTEWVERWLNHVARKVLK
jgi:hypothetical protein